jgi:hypothetical protein
MFRNRDVKAVVTDDDNNDIVADLLKALPGNGSVNTFPRIGPCYAMR